MSRTPPRIVWILALVVGAVCTAAFVHVMLLDAPAAHTPVPTAVQTPTGPGFGTGILVGIAVGIVIGVALQRARASSAKTP